MIEYYLSAALMVLLLLIPILGLWAAWYGRRTKNWPENQLCDAIIKNDLVKITDLLDRYPKLVQGTVAFYNAILRSTTEVVSLFIERGADPNIGDENGTHPLNMACQSSALEMFQELIRYGSDPRRADGLTGDAAMFGRTDILRYLQQVGFDLNQPSIHVCPLEKAIRMGHTNTVDYLLGENVDIPSSIDTSKPLKPWKGAFPDKGAMEEIRKWIIARRL